MIKNESHPYLRGDPQPAACGGVHGGSPPRLAVLGGDLRTESLAAALSDAGFPLRSFACPMKGESSLAAALDGASAVILPIPASRDGASLFAPFYKGDPTCADSEGGKISLCKSLLPAVLRYAPGAEILCGMPPDEFAAEAERAGIPLFDYGKDEEFLLENADLTAEGMLPLLDRHLGAPLEKKIGEAVVAGFGRVGKAAAKALAGRGVKVTVLCRSAKAMEEAKKQGYPVLSFESVYTSGLPDTALLCGTVPAPVFDGTLLSSFGGLYVELASGTGGLTPDALAVRKDDPTAYLALPGVPGKVLPVRAGLAAARAVLRRIGTETGKGAALC